MKFMAATAMAIIASTKVLAGTPAEERVFSILEQDGVFVEYSSTTAQRTGKIELRSITCNQTDHTKSTRCIYVDMARPMEKGSLEGRVASEMFDLIVLSGAKSVHFFGETHIGLSILQCAKTESVSTGNAAFECRTMKPFVK